MGALTQTAFRLDTFGGLSLAGTGGAVTLSQRRRLALLALLAVVGEQGMQRDKLLLYLWPESTPDTARHSLEQLIYGLRRELGQSLFSAANPLILDSGALSSDVGDFDAAIRSGALAEAVQLYRGPFLDGFYLSGLPEFEEWTSTERRRLAGACASALEKLAVESGHSGDHSREVELWRKRAALDSLSARGAVGLMRALAESGDRAGALQHARIYEVLVGQQLQSPVDPEVAALASKLRNRSTDTSTRLVEPIVTRPSGTATVVSAQAIEYSVADAPPGDSAPDESGATSRLAAPAPRVGWKRSAGTTRLAAISALLVLLVFAGRWLHRMSTAADKDGVTLDPQRVVVVPFRVTGTDSSLAYLREGMVDLLAAELTGEGGLLAVDPRTTLNTWQRFRSAGGNEVSDVDAFRLARAVGAGHLLLGEVVLTANARLVLNGTVVSVPDRDTRARASVTGRADSLPALVDRLTAALLTQHAGEGDQHVAALANTSLPVLRAYLDGRSALRRGHYHAAIARFTRALELDSTFALGGLALASAAGFSFKLRPGDQAVGDEAWWSEADSAWRRGVEIAWRNEQLLTTSDRAYLRGLRGTRYPSGTSALEQVANWERTVQTAPDRADAWYRFGLILMYQGPGVEVRESHARAGTAFRRALALDSGFVAPLAGLLEIAAFARDSSEVRRMGALYLSRDSLGETVDYIRWRMATIVGDSAALRALRARMHAMNTESLGRIQWTSQVDGIAVDDADRALSELLRRAGNRVERARALGQARMLALNRGRPREALRIDDNMLDLEGLPYWNPAFRVTYASYWGADTSAGAVSAHRIELHATAMLASGSATPAVRAKSITYLFVGAQWRLWRGDTAGAARTIALLKSEAREESARGGAVRRANLHRSDVIEALLAAVTRRPDAVALLDRLDSLTLGGCCETPHYANQLVARLREREGNAPAALRAIRRARWYFPPEYLSSNLREEGRLAALTGDREGAIRAYRHYLALWANPEPAVKVHAERVRAELGRLQRGH